MLLVGMALLSLQVLIAAALLVLASADEATPAPPIFVINLAHRTERLARFDEQMKAFGNLDYTRIDAIGAEESSEELAKGRVQVNATYTDPYLHRRMKIGEVGCGLSHIKAWKAIASTVPDNEYAIVFEDDVVFDDEYLHGDVNIGERFNELAFMAAQHDADFVYLAYQEVGGREKEEVDDHFDTCVYSYWACAYMVSSNAARRLVEDEEYYRKNLIPSDEYLPIVLGVFDNRRNHSEASKSCHTVGAGTCEVTESGRDPRYPNVRLSCLALKHEFIWPGLNLEVQSDTESSGVLAADQSHVFDSSEILVLTVIDDEDHFGYRNLRRSVEYFGYRFIALRAEHEYIEKGKTLSLVKAFLDELAKNGDNDTIVLYTSGYVTLFQLGPDALLELYNERASDIVFASERACHSDPVLCNKYAHLLEATENSSENEFVYLNSGNYIGRVKHLNMLLKDVDGNDSLIDNHYFLSKLVEQIETVSIGVDMKCDIFQVLDGADIDLLDDEPFRVFTNDVTDSRSVVLQGNGASSRTLVGVGNYVAGGHDDFYGAQQHRRIPQYLVEIYPLAIGLFFIGTPSEQEFVESIQSLSLDWNKVDMYVYYGGSPLRISEDDQQSYRSFSVLQPDYPIECTARASFMKWRNSQVPCMLSWSIPTPL
jgi:hypothetical protein